MRKLLILGGDERSCELYFILREVLDVDITGFDRKENIDTVRLDKALSNIWNWKYIVLPVPHQQNGYIKMPFSEHLVNAEKCLHSFAIDQTVFLGATGKEPETGARVVNILKDAKYGEENAYLTAVAARGLLALKYGTDARNKDVLVLGYGKIAKNICRMMKNDGADVCAAARREEVLRQIEADGYSAMNIYRLENTADFDIVFNTVPSRVLGKQELKGMRALIIDLASYPYGVDFDAAENAHLELSLPGEYLPAEEAKNIAALVMSKIKEEDKWN